MTVTDQQIAELRRCLDRTIGGEATSTVMTMLTSVDPTTLATKSDLVSLAERIDHKFVLLEERYNSRFERLEERMSAQSDQFDLKLASMEDRITASTMKAINRHLTFSVTAMMAISGMFTWLAH